MIAPAAAPTTLASIRDKLRAQQQSLQHQIDLAKSNQKDIEAQQKQTLADFTALDKIASDQQGQKVAVDKAISDADDALHDLEPMIDATLDAAARTKLKDRFDTLNNGLRAEQQAVDDAIAQLNTRQNDQADAQVAADRQAEIVKQRLAAITQLPATKRDLTGLLQKQQSDLHTAITAGNMSKAYVILLVLQSTRAQLYELQQDAYEQRLAQQYVDAEQTLEDKRGDLVRKREATLNQQDALAKAKDDLKTAKDGYDAGLTKLWAYQP
jgi:hypothetical protein